MDLKLANEKNYFFIKRNANVKPLIKCKSVPVFGQLLLLNASFFLCVVRPWFKMRCVSLTMKKLLHTQNMFINAIEIFFIDVKSANTLTLKNENFWFDFGLILPWFEKSHSCPTWSATFFFLCVVRPWFKMHCVPLLLKKSLYTQNMFISAIENFLHRRKVWIFCNRGKINSKSCQKL